MGGERGREEDGSGGAFFWLWVGTLKCCGVEASLKRASLSLSPDQERDPRVFDDVFLLSNNESTTSAELKNNSADDSIEDINTKKKKNR